MATRALVDSSVDAFWEAAGPSTRRPRTPPELRRREGGGSLTARGPPKRLTGSRPGGGVPLPPRSSAVEEAGADSDALAEYSRVAVELSGRAGYNDAAVNGSWKFWRIYGGRLAFRRDTEVEVLGSDDPELENCNGEGDSRETVSCMVIIRLFLFYQPHVDAWLISDALEEGNVAADCGRVGLGEDLDQHWRVWDGTHWKQDRNVVARVVYDGPAPASLQGLRVLPASAAGSRPPAVGKSPRAISLDSRARPGSELPRVPLTGLRVSTMLGSRATQARQSRPRLVRVHPLQRQRWLRLGTRVTLTQPGHDIGARMSRPFRQLPFGLRVSEPLAEYVMSKNREWTHFFVKVRPCVCRRSLAHPLAATLASIQRRPVVAIVRR
eukprot:TRINITY_DN17481_c0_g1_i2.p1 TRINITY_DN17481_c0_g1~~TRINITY_DN17481_c0_g1_i2.p1  ORF type:complete len:381 (+),score=33.00 TRINITY_DN17481_c0_g1_i2:127-1269(+)